MAREDATRDAFGAGAGVAGAVAPAAGGFPARRAATRMGARAIVREV
jgi:hypothetical protein